MRLLSRRLARWGARRLAAVLAGRALTCAVYGDCGRGHRITADTIERGGRLAVESVAAVWCEAMLDGLPRSTRKNGTFRPVVMDGGRVLDPEQVPPPLLWAMRLVAAHAARDRVMCAALIGAVPDSEVEQHLKVLLHVAAQSVATRSEEAVL
ncbi:hypothetical protein [Actinomadura formosensis]|uniref:hypothetical protein n=1 Tax=Actinomadura formosensis TaxID=60706 RepID=UPI003D91752B